MRCKTEQGKRPPASQSDPGRTEPRVTSHPSQDGLGSRVRLRFLREMAVQAGATRPDRIRLTAVTPGGGGSSKGTTPVPFFDQGKGFSLFQSRKSPLKKNGRRSGINGVPITAVLGGDPLEVTAADTDLPRDHGEVRFGGLDGNEKTEGYLLRCPVHAVEAENLELTCIKNGEGIKRFCRGIPDGE